MSYSDFTLKQVQHDFNLDIIEKRGIFSTLDPVKISNYLAVTLEENIPLAIEFNIDKKQGLN